MSQTIEKEIQAQQTSLEKMGVLSQGMNLTFQLQIPPQSAGSDPQQFCGMTASVTITLPPGAISHSGQGNTNEFERQKRAFLDIPTPLLAKYEGKFVVSHNGKIIESDKDLPTLTHRFFHENPHAAVYITKIGPAIREVVVTPY
jgi:hypothetical protein